MANLENLKAVREYIRANPEKHEQRFWAQQKKNECGTALCLAGTAALLAGMDFDWSQDKTLDLPDKVVTGFLTNGEAVWVFAQKWLDLTGEEVEDLFYEWDEEKALDKLDQLIKDCENAV